MAATTTDVRRQYVVQFRDYSDQQRTTYLAPGIHFAITRDVRLAERHDYESGLALLIALDEIAEQRNWPEGIFRMVEV